MEVGVNESKLEKRRRREQKQLFSLNRQKEKGKYKGYFAVLLVIIVLVDLLDNFTTSVNANVTSCFINEFFVNGQLFGKSYTYEEGLALNNTIGLLGYVIAMLTPFYKALADKWGRKPLFVISTLGMVTGLMLIYTCTSYVMFLIGTFTINFFLSHDVQIIYVLEEAPSQKRARVYSALKGIGAMGAFFIPLLRATMMHNDETLWRNVYLVPAICGFIISLAVLVFAKETDVFIDERSVLLARPLEERLAEEAEHKKQKKAHAEKGGVINAIKYIFQHKDLRTLVIIKTIFDAAIIAMTMYEPMMTEGGMSTENITKAMFLYPIIYGVSVFISGFFADKIGRKTTVAIFGSLCLAAFVVFIIVINSGWNPYLVGIAYGLYIGGYWIGRDYMEIISTEMVPTEIRASIVGAVGLLVYVGMAVGFVFVNVGILFAPIWLVCLIFSAPCVGVAVVLLMLKVKETKGTDYEKIGAEQE